MRATKIVISSVILILFCTLCLSQANSQSTSNTKRLRDLRQTRTIKLIVNVNSDQRKKGDPLYDFESNIRTRLATSGLTILPATALEGDVTLYADCLQTTGTNYGVKDEGGSTWLGGTFRLEHPKYGQIWRQPFAPGYPYRIRLDNQYNTSVATLEKMDLYYKYLGNLVLAKLGKIDEPALFLQILSDDNSVVRAEAINNLRILKDPRSFQPLVKLLNDENRDVARSAVAALEELGDPRAFNPLTNLFLISNNRLVQIGVVFALEKLDPAKALIFFRGVAQDPKYDDRHDLAEQSIKKLSSKQP